MNIVTKVGGGRITHAASYERESGRIVLMCGSLKYRDYHAVISDYTPPTTSNVTCKLCSRKLGVN